jgi:hypothetical protein
LILSGDRKCSSGMAWKVAATTGADRPEAATDRLLEAEVRVRGHQPHPT